MIVVETEACGICRSDWHAWRGDPVWADRGLEEGHVFGHGPAGVADALGASVVVVDLFEDKLDLAAELDAAATVRAGDDVDVPEEIEAGKLDPAAVVSETVSLEEVPARFEAMTDYETAGVPVVDTF